MHDLLEIHYSTLGFLPQDDDEEHLDTLARLSAVEWMCKVDYVDCVLNAQEYFQGWMNQNEKIPVGYEDIVLNTAIRRGNIQQWEFLLEKVKDATDESKKEKYIVALTRTYNASTIQRLVFMTSLF